MQSFVGMKNPFAFLSLALLFFCVRAFANTNQGPVVDVLDPEFLQRLDKPGLFSFATVVGAELAESHYLRQRSVDPAMSRLKIIRLDGLSQAGNHRYDAIAAQVKADVEDLQQTSGEKMAYSSEQAEILAPAGNVARHFDPYWLNSKHAAFPLIAVVNRIDKKDMHPDSCGELRFVYRLAYYKADAQRSSRGSELLIESRSTLPVFLNVVFAYHKGLNGRCEDVARLWSGAPSEKERERFFQWLLSGSLDKRRIDLKQIELNMQIVRFPAGQKTDFGGQAIYLFRIFKDDQGAFKPLPLENTPNVSEVLKSADLRADLIRQLTDPVNLSRIDQGTFVLENTGGKLLATRALSFSTSGRARLSNKPFTSIFGPMGGDLSQADLSRLKFIKTTSGLVERMNNASCVGCHQASGTAGFHLMGLTGSLNSAFNQVMVPFSPHYYAERVRRSAYTQALAHGRLPNLFRPLSIHPPARWSRSAGVPDFEVPRTRDLCLMDSRDFSAAPACETGSKCTLTVENKAIGAGFGECVSTPLTTAGHICRKGVVNTAATIPEWGDLFNLTAFRDTVNVNQTILARGNLCGHPKGGVPLGRIAKACDLHSPDGKLAFVDKLASASAAPKEICAMRGGPQFDECAKTKNPPDCLANAKIVRS